MTDYLSQLVGKYKKKGIFVDSEILLLFIVGTKDPNLIGNFGRTAKFDENDFILVSSFIDYFYLKITSPHILTEVSDLLGESNDFQFILKTYINIAEEVFLPSKNVAKSESFLKFGLADSAIIEVSKNSYLIFTADNRFYGYLSNMGIDAVNFNLLKSTFK
ncbi:hypothetical protein BH20ACI1_BH20ACI1_15430 [soil metagenome]